MLISDLNESKVGEILNYLARTDDEYANAKANLESAEILRKRVRAKVFLASSEDETVAVRNAETEAHDDTQAADDAYVSALRTFETLKAKRQRAELYIDVFRTLEASRRRVMV